ncbi:MAG TPA: DUF481 domain-containing protein [Steroidobacteraceae bacterium]|jgi:putative salt-induced outer membrane protein|nr:DUF481 domain-containing protein [Steroidobacteraceae bacterium]
MIQARLAAALIAIVPAVSAWADDAPPPPPQHEWIGKGQAGFLDSHGNADAESINANVDMLRYDGPWKNELYVGGLYGKSSSVVSAERWETRGQSNYDLTPRTFLFGALRFEHDLFDGFQYQASATSGVGYKLIDSDSTKLAAQVGAGYRRLRPEDIFKNPDGIVTARVLHDSQGEAIGTMGIDFMHAFNKSTSITNKFLAESGSDNTMLHDELALNVKMTDKLALSVGYAATDNTTPPPTLKKLDTLTTVNLVFSF